MSRQLSIIEQRIVWTRFRRETDKTVLRELARWFCWRADGTHICPRSVGALAEKTEPYGISYRSTERALQRLEDGGWIEAARDHRHATTYRICLERLATQDPDMVTVVVDNSDIDRHSGGQIDGLTAKVADRSRSDRQSGGQVADNSLENGPDFEKVADKRSAAEVRTKTSTSSTASDVVRQFLEWFTTTYPIYNHGAQFTIHRSDSQVAQDVLRRRTLGRVQAMTIAMWQVKEADHNPKSHRSWIVTTDRSIRVLRKAANFLDRLVTGLDAQQLSFGPMDDAPSRQPGVKTKISSSYEVTGTDVWSNILRRIETKLNRHTFISWFPSTVLVEDRGDVLEVATKRELAAEWIQKHFGDVVRQAVEEERPGARVEFISLKRSQTG